ncbi:MAG: ABC transporter substrate-binding protein [Firmicutes bacterium]|nr:ABC transporter substrate-binding protein [Bacillota bacterium]
MGREGDAVKLDPADITDGESAQVTENIFDTLVTYRNSSTQIKPDLALSWSSSKNGKIWIFHLRHHVRFQDGTKFNAASVVFNFDQWMNPKDPYHKYGKFIYWQTMWGGFPGKVKKIQAIGKYTVKFTLSQPVAPFLKNLAMFCFAISSPTAVKKWKEDYFKHPVGTGPFKLVLWQRNERIVLNRNPYYWGEKPKIKRLIFVPIKDSTTRMLELERGDIDFMTGVNVEEVKILKKDPAVRVLAKPGMNIAYLAMNCEKPPFNQIAVRQAVRYAINIKKIVEKLYEGLAVPAVNPIPPMILGYNPRLKKFHYNPRKAKELLAKAGFPNGFSTTLWYPPISRQYIPDPKAVAEAMQADLRKVGIKVKLITYDWGSYLYKTEMGEHSMAILGWIGDNGDPDDFLYALLDKTNAVKPAQNIAFYTNEKVHRLLLQAQKIFNPEKRKILYRQAIQIINQDSPWVPIAYADQIVAFNKKVKGFHLNPTGMLRFQNVEENP